MAIPPLRNVTIGYAITIVVVVLILLYTFLSLTEQKKSLKNIQQYREDMQVLGNSLVAVQEMEAGLATFLHSKEKSENSFFEQWLSRFKSDSVHYSNIIKSGIPIRVAAYKELLITLQQIKDTTFNIIIPYAANGKEYLHKLWNESSLSVIIDHYKTIVSRQEDYIRNSISIFYADTLKYTSNTFAFVKTISIVLTLILLLSFFIYYKENRKKQLAESQIQNLTEDLERKVQMKTAEIRENEEKFKIIYNNTDDIIFLVTYTSEKEYYFDTVNKAFLDSLGLSEDQVKGKKVKDLLPEASASIALEKYNHVIQSGKAYSWEQVSKTPPGSKVRSITITPVKNEATGDIMLVGFAHDITERKKAERELSEAESKFRNLIEQSLVGVYIIDKGNFIYVNPRFAKIFGYTQEELIGSNPLKVITDNHKAMVAENVRSRIAGEKQSIHYEAQGITKSDELVFIEVFCSGTLFEGSTAIIGTILDITERKKAEADTIKATERFNLIAKATNDIVWDWDMVNDSNWGNDAFYRYYGLAPGEVSTNAVFTSRVHPDDIGRIIAKLEKCIANKEEQIVDEFRFRIPDGTYRFFYDRAYLIYDANGKPLRMLGSMIDITEIKEAVAEKEQANYLLNERIKELTTLYQCGQILQDENSSVESIIKKVVAVIPGGWQFSDHASARITIGDIEFESSDFQNNVHTQTATFDTPDDKAGMIQVSYTKKMPEADEGPFLKEERDLINMLANMLKIYLTKRHETEALKQSEANLHTIFNTTDTMYALFDREAKLISNNQRMIDFAKKELKAVSNNTGTLDFKISQNKQEIFSQNLARGLKGEFVSYEINYPQTDGTDNWYYVRIIPVTNEEKEVLGLMVAMSDITGTKRMEKQILAREIQEQKKITRAVLKAEENARNKIGQELHDNVNQILAGTKLYLSMADKSELGNSKAIQNSIQLIDRAIEEIRALSKSHVTPIREVNLKQLIFSLMDKYNETSSVKTRVVYDIQTNIIEDDLKLNIYRIVQEQMNNIIKHAKASSAWITLKQENKVLFVEVEDDGVGFDITQQRTGIGISNITNRVQSFNGEIKIESAIGKGTKLKIKIPLQAAAPTLVL